MMADTPMKERKQPKTNKNNKKKTPSADGHRAGRDRPCLPEMLLSAAAVTWSASSSTDRQRSFPAHRLSKAAGNLELKEVFMNAQIN